MTDNIDNIILIRAHLYNILILIPHGLKLYETAPLILKRLLGGIILLKAIPINPQPKPKKVADHRTGEAFELALRCKFLEHIHRLDLKGPQSDPVSDSNDHKRHIEDTPKTQQKH